MTALKPYPAYKPAGVDGLDEIPVHWEVHRIKNVVDTKVSNVDKHVREGELPVRLCNYSDVYKNDRITGRISFMEATATAKEVERFRLKPDDILITKDSEVWNEIAIPALVEYVAEDLVCGYHLALLRPREMFLSGGYLLRALQSPWVACQFHLAAKGITRYGLSHDAIKSVLLPMPSLRDQTAIVRYLDHRDQQLRRYIRAEQKLIKLMEEQKQDIIHRAVTRGLDPNVRLKPSKVEWLGDVPEHWERRRLKSLLRLIDRRSTTGTETLLSLRRDFGVVPYSDHFSRPAQSESLVGFKLVSVDQLVVNRMQANNGLVFRSALSGIVSPDYSVFDKRAPVRVQFLSELLRTSTYRAHFRRVATGLGTGTSGFLRLYDNKLLETLVYLPRYEEQMPILEYLDKAALRTDTAIARAHRKIDLLEEFRIRLIADVVTGKLDVREADVQLPDKSDDRQHEREVVA